MMTNKLAKTIVYPPLFLVLAAVVLCSPRVEASQRDLVDLTCNEFLSKSNEIIGQTTSIVAWLDSLAAAFDNDRRESFEEQTKLRERKSKFAEIMTVFCEGNPLGTADQAALQAMRQYREQETGVPAREVRPTITGRVALRRMGCSAGCPEYSIAIYSTGRVLYHGYANVDLLGSVETKMDVADFVYLEEMAYAVGYFDMLPKYTQSEEANAEVVTSLVDFDGIRHRIDRSSGDRTVPEALIEYENLLETMTDVWQWSGDRVSYEEIPPEYQ